MSKTKILLALLFSSHYYYLLYASTPNPNPSSFIKAECRATLYEALCIQSLSAYSKPAPRTPKQLARAALSVGLASARSGSAFLAKAAHMRGLRGAERRAVEDCAANMAGAVDQLSRSAGELGRMGRSQAQGGWHRSNVESWIGAAMTFQQTCLDGFSSPAMNGNVKVAVMKRVLHCKQVASNALVLIHRYAAGEKGANLP